jgi:hypothetical protein
MYLHVHSHMSDMSVSLPFLDYIFVVFIINTLFTFTLAKPDRKFE